MEFGYIEGINTNLKITSGLNTRGDNTKEFKKQLKKYLKNQPDKSKELKKLGHISWNNVRHEINQNNIDFYAVPLIHGTSTQTEAILLGAMNGNEFKFTMLIRGRVKDLPRKSKQSEPIKFLTMELAVVTISFFDYKLFGELDCGLVGLLENVIGDNKIKIRACHYEITENYNCYYVGKGDDGWGTWYTFDCQTSYSYEYVCDYRTDYFLGDRDQSKTNTDGGNESSTPQLSSNIVYKIATDQEITEKLKKPLDVYDIKDYEGFIDKTLVCESFVFNEQKDGSGYTTCVEGLYLNKTNFKTGNYSRTRLFCLGITVPKTRYFDGDRIYSRLEASDCAAWASNAAAAWTSLYFLENEYSMELDYQIIRVYKDLFNKAMKKTDCGYGSVTNCNSMQGGCVSKKAAIWNEGFTEWIKEVVFNCASR